MEPTITEPLANVGESLPKATMTLFNFNDQFGENFKFTVKSLGPLNGDWVYGLYIISAASAAHYDPADPNNIRILFNVDFSAGSWHRLLGPTGFFDSPTITVFVVREKDDERQFNPGIDLSDVILEGTSTLP